MSNLEVFLPSEGPRDERKEIACAMREKHFDDGSTISGHTFEDIEEHDNCHVVVSRCKDCGYVSVGWWHMDKPPVRLGEDSHE